MSNVNKTYYGGHIEKKYDHFSVLTVPSGAYTN